MLNFGMGMIEVILLFSSHWLFSLLGGLRTGNFGVVDGSDTYLEDFNMSPCPHLYILASSMKLLDGS